ncbi:hypothetical protein [Acidihalobacter prosperus]|nr:hypothetical protein [Acidihalobacter prosperus]
MNASATVNNGAAEPLTATERPMGDSTRLLVCHKQATSARLRFLRLPWGATLFSPLPEGAHPGDAPDAPSRVHPAACVRAAARWLDLPTASLCAVPGFHRRIRLPDGHAAEVVLLRVTEVDPPFAAAARREARFVDLLEVRDLPPTELGLLREAYVHLLGG